MTGTTSIAAVLAVAREKRAAAKAASLAFYAFNVLVTLVVLGYAAFTLAGDSLLPSVVQVLTGLSTEAIEGTLEQVGGEPWSSPASSPSGVPSACSAQ